MDQAWQERGWTKARGPGFSGGQGTSKKPAGGRVVRVWRDQGWVGYWVGSPTQCHGHGWDDDDDDDGGQGAG